MIAACKLLLFVLFGFCSCCLLVVVVVVMCPEMFGDFVAPAKSISGLSMCGAAAPQQHRCHKHCSFAFVFLQWCRCRDVAMLVIVAVLLFVLCGFVVCCVVVDLFLTC